MSAHCLCSSKTQFLCFLISDLIHLCCSFVLSHPIYFSYFIFFSPYLFKTVHFLSPLLLTSSFLVIIASCGEGCFGHSLCVQNEGCCFEDLGMYEILFGPSIVEVVKDETIVQAMEEKLVESCQQECDSDKGVKMGRDDVQRGEEKRLENFLKILDQFERMASNVDEKKKGTPFRATWTNKVVDEQVAMKIGSQETIDKADIVAEVSVSDSSNGGDQEKESLVAKVSLERKIGFAGTVNKANVDIDVAGEVSVGNSGNGGDRQEESLVAKVGPEEKYDGYRSFGSSDDCDLGGYGSMRKEKEWKRTLACKLFEERHNVGGGEGMDSLWEAHEMKANKQPKNEKEMKTKSKAIKREVDDEEGVEGPLCCLQAIKLSTRKMNLGMGRPNLVKITKAIKGIGWLHKQSKKVHNNGDRY